MKLKAAIIDDDGKQREYLYETVTAWAKKNRYVIEIKKYGNAKGFLFDYSEEKDFDILLLDIEMPEMSGVELAKRLRGDGCLSQIVFITGYPDFISEGYDVAALHYLLKPLNRDKLFEVLDRAVKSLDAKPRYICFTSGKETLRLAAKDILYGESDGHYVVLHTVNGEHRLRMTVPELAEHLGDGFVRPSRSFVVGLSHVGKITKTDVFLDNGVKIPVAKGAYDGINLALIKYLREN